jgi:hypothetical protein
VTRSDVRTVLDPRPQTPADPDNLFCRASAEHRAVTKCKSFTKQLEIGYIISKQNSDTTIHFHLSNMARSNLHISPSLTEAFLSAQQFSIGTRCIKVLIEGETLILSSIIPRVNNAQEDFDSLATSTLDANQATILLFCLTDQAIEKQNWLLLSFIPDGCKVREKMLYSSSREDLKRAMGLGFFSQDYSANTLPEIKWALLKAYMSNDHRKEEYLSEKEKMIREEQVSYDFKSIALLSASQKPSQRFLFF